MTATSALVGGGAAPGSGGVSRAVEEDMEGSSTYLVSARKVGRNLRGGRVEVSKFAHERGIAVVAYFLECSGFHLRHDADLVAQ